MDRLRPYLPILLICLGLLGVQVSYGLCPQDDAFISFRYAANLADGHGLVFNPGERVEGYTNFLWTLIFAPVIALGLDPVSVSTSLGMVFSALLLWSSWELSGRRWLVPLLVACFPGLSLEAVQGLETVAFAFWVCQALRGEKNWAMWAGLAALTRPEGFAVFGLLWIWRRDWRSVGLFGAFTVPHLVFRVLYYGDIVPNTFHAKVGGGDTIQGSALSRGAEYLGQQVLDLRGELPQPHLLLLALLLLAGLGRVVRRGRPWLPTTAVLRDALCLTLFYLTYVAVVGGDFKGTGRFVIPILASLALLGVHGIEGFMKGRVRTWGRGLLALLGVALALPGLSQMQTYAAHFSGVWERQQAIAGFLASADLPDTDDYALAVHGAGLIPYYSELRTLDMWGLNDSHIARAEVESFGTGRAGHERGDYAYVLSRRPLIILPEPHIGQPFPAWKLPGSPIREDAFALSLDGADFGPALFEAYRPVVAECDTCAPENHWLHFWIRRDAIGAEGLDVRQVKMTCPVERCQQDRALVQNLWWMPGE